MKKQDDLFGSGILMILGGILAAVTGIVIMVNGAAADGLASSTLLAAGGVNLACCLASIVAGIGGIAHGADPEHIGVYHFWAAVVAAMGILGGILGVVGGAGFYAASLVFSVLLPALYVVASGEYRAVKTTLSYGAAK